MRKIADFVVREDKKEYRSNTITTGPETKTLEDLIAYWKGEIAELRPGRNNGIDNTVYTKWRIVREKK